jgi:RNA polymerase sigma-70 factor, ECF subfamily
MTQTSRPVDPAFETELTGLIPQMRAFARSLCGDATEADDLAQQALLRAWAKRDSYEPGTNMRAWVFMIVRNQFYSEKRRSWRASQLDPAVAEATLVAVDDPTAALSLDEVRRAVTLLPEEQREALILIAAGGLAYEEAAEICGVAVGTMKSRVSRARDRLALILENGAQPEDGGLPHNAMASILGDFDRLRSVIAA